MNTEEKQNFIRQKARQNQLDPEGARIRWSRHGITELVNEGWSRALVEEALQSGRVIEDYPTLHRPLPFMWRAIKPRAGDRTVSLV